MNGKTIKEALKNHSADDIIINNHYIRVSKIKDKDMSKSFGVSGENYILNQMKVFNSMDILNSLCNMGENFINYINEETLDSFISIKEKIKYVLDYKMNDIKKMVDSWIGAYGFPYAINANNADYFIKFYYDSIYCYSLLNFHGFLIKFGKLKGRWDLVNKDKINSFLFFENILVDMLTEIHNDSSFDITCSPIAYFYEYKRINEKIDYKLNTENYIFIYRNAMLIYMMKLFENENYGDTFKIDTNYVYFDSDIKDYTRINVAHSLVGAAYNRLLQDLISNQESSKTIVCQNPDCNKKFIKDGKSLYCKECRKEKIPAKIRYIRWYEEHHPKSQ